MAEINIKRQEVAEAEKRGNWREQLFDRLEPRITTLLIFAPPTLGVIAGGVAVNAYRRLSGLDLPRLPHDYVTLGLLVFCCAGFLVIGYFSARVYRGARTRFPRLLRIAPFTALAGFILGIIIASLKAAGKIH
jgi:hypothetical protein